MSSRRVAVVGGGTAGLTAAYRLRRSLGPCAEIVLVEQSDRLGGKLRTVELAGREFDVGAEAFLARREEIPRLAREIGLDQDIVHPGPASARIRAGGRVQRLPSATFMGVPTSPHAASDVLSEAGGRAVRAESDLPPLSLHGSDISVGALLRERVGEEVAERLVEPLLGGVYAGTADSLGLRATAPGLAAALDAGAKSVTDAAAAAAPDPPAAGAPKPPVFGAFRGGYRQLLDRLAAEANAECRFGVPVRSVAALPHGWRLTLGSAARPEELDADAVVLAVPAPSARRLLHEVAPAASEQLATMELASMAVIGMALPADVELPDQSGVLIARGEHHRDGTPFTAKAFTFSSRKWPHLRGAAGELLLRASIGRAGGVDELRHDDAELVRRVRSDLAELTGVAAEPVHTVVARWGGGLPQYGVGHLDKVAEIERTLGEIPGLELAGATLHGVGVPACAATGEAAAARVTSHLVPD